MELLRKFGTLQPMPENQWGLNSLMEESEGKKPFYAKPESLSANNCVIGRHNMSHEYYSPNTT